MLCQSSISNFESTNAPAKQYCMKQSGWGSMSRIKCHLCRQWQWTVTLICNDWRQQQELLSLAQQCVLSLVHHWLLSLAQQSLLSLAQQALLSLAQQALPNWPKIYKFAYRTIVSDLKQSNPAQWYSKLKRMTSFDDQKYEQVIIENISHLSNSAQAEIIANNFTEISNSYEPIQPE